MYRLFLLANTSMKVNTSHPSRLVYARSEVNSSTKAPRSIRLSHLVGGSYFYRHAALCSAVRIAECIIARFYARMRLKIRFLLSQSYWKLIIGSNKGYVALITRIYILDSYLKEIHRISTGCLETTTLFFNYEI